MVKRIDNFIFIPHKSDNTKPFTHLFPQKCRVTTAKSDGQDALLAFVNTYKPQIGDLRCFQEKNGYSTELGHPFRLVVDLDSSSELDLENVLVEIRNIVNQYLCSKTNDINIIVCILKKAQSGRFHIHLLNLVCNNQESYKAFLNRLHLNIKNVDNKAGLNYFMSFGSVKTYRAERSSSIEPSHRSCYLPWKMLHATNTDQMRLNNFSNIPEFDDFENSDKYCRFVFNNFFRSHVPSCVANTLFGLLSLHRKYIDEFDHTLPIPAETGTEGFRKRKQKRLPSVDVPEEEDDGDDEETNGWVNKRKKKSKGRLEILRETYLENALFKLPSYYYDNYNGWSFVGFLIAREWRDAGRFLYHKFSSLSKKYNAETVDAKFTSLLAVLREGENLNQPSPALGTTHLAPLLLESNSILEDMEKKMFHSWKGPIYSIVSAVGVYVRHMSPMLIFPHPLNANYIYAIEYCSMEGIYRPTHDTFMQSFGGQRGTMEMSVERSEHYGKLLDCIIYLALKNYNDNHRFTVMCKAHETLDSTPSRLKVQLNSRITSEERRNTELSFYRRLIVKKLNKLMKRWGSIEIAKNRSNKYLWSKLYSEFDYGQALVSAKRHDRYSQSVFEKAIVIKDNSVSNRSEARCDQEYQVNGY
uniref:U16-like protein n=1 Tax=Glypta fumiferanae TaxID=389681 RepID=A0A0F6Q8A1_9HYME|nr:U16-like protein [Glypta fumiferanae]